MEQQFFYIPENIDLDDIFRKNPTNNIDGFNREKLLYTLHLISDIPSTNKDLTNEEGYVPINAEILRQWIGKGYSDYLTYLQEAGIIETDNQFIRNVKSRGYRFYKKYQQPLKSIPVTKSTLVKKMADNKQPPKVTREPPTSNKGTVYNNMVVVAKEKQTNTSTTAPSNLSTLSSNYAPIEKWYNSGGLIINSELAHSYNEGIYLQKKDDRSKWDKPTNGKGDKRKNPYIQYLGNHLNIEKIRKGQFNAHYDTNVFRYHSVLTNCKKELRNTINFGGEELVAIDLSNSQPVLLTLLLDNDFWLNEGQGGKLNSSDIPYIFLTPIFSNNIHFTNSITLCKKAQSNRIVVGNEVSEFYRMVSSGNFYSEFRQLLKDNLGLDYKTNEEVKPMLFTVLFTGNSFIGQAEAAPKKVFKDLFPRIYEITALIKRYRSENLPILLQRIESYIMYHRIVPRITREREDLPIFTLHDSIVTLKEYEDYVENVMREEFGKCLGFTPHFKREDWKEANLGLVV